MVLCCLVLLFLARPAPGAEGSSIAQQVVGTWDVQSVTITSADGSVVDPFGSKPSGIIMLDTNGRYANVFGRADRPKIDAANRLAITNLCFGGDDMRDVWATASSSGKLYRLRWPRPGLRLHEC